MVYRDDAIVTRRDRRGVPVSSSSQPSIMAAMLEALALEPGNRVLEVGAGTGYNAALLARLVGPRGRVTSVELDPELVADAANALSEGGHPVDVVVGDGRAGWPEGAPYNRIIVTASGRDIPRAWFDQLGDDGLLVLPLWLRGSFQTVVALRRVAEGFESVGMIPGGFMELRANLDEEPPVTHDQLNASDHVGSVAARPLVSISGPALRLLQPAERRRLLALALGPPRPVRLASPARASDLRLFLSLTAHEDRFVEWYDSSLTDVGPGVVGRCGASLAVLGQGPTVDHLDAWGDDEAEQVLSDLVEQWHHQGRPGPRRLRIAVRYEPSRHDPATSPPPPCIVSFDWG